MNRRPPRTDLNDTLFPSTTLSRSLFQDDTRQRTSGIAGERARTPFATVRGLDASLGFSRRYGRLGGRVFAGRPDCRVPSLEDTAACLLDLGLTPNVEIKPTPDRKSTRLNSSH